MATILLSLAAGAAIAGDTFDKIRVSRSITLGVRESSIPFSYLVDGRAVGYSVDLCLAAVDEVKRTLKMPDLQVRYRVVSGAERIPSLLAGEIDLECGSTTNTKARLEKVDFSYTIFVAGMRVLTPVNVKLESVADLRGLMVATSKGTTSEKLFTQLAAGEVPMRLQSFSSNGEAYSALKAGKVSAFPQDDSLLQGLMSRDGEGARLSLSRIAMSVEPYAIMLRRDDAPLRAAVDKALVQIYASGQIHALYDRWFHSPSLTIAMSRLTRDSFLRPNREPGVAMLLGYSL
jgi:glutamate/aspartate transport system substrate-binding protein